MIHSKKGEESNAVDSVFASRYTSATVPKFRLAKEGIPKEAAYQMIHDELLLDCNPRLNLASFVTTWMEPECDKLIVESLNKNYIDIEEYPITNELQDRCVNIIANLFHAPLGANETACGTGCVGSSEAIMLAGLAFKRRWQLQRKAAGKPYDKPNIIFGSEVQVPCDVINIKGWWGDARTMACLCTVLQVCWEKFANYFEVEMKFVNIEEGSFVMDVQRAVDMVDENTICVAGILGSTYNGEFEDIKRLNDLLLEKNKATGLDVGIHVDGASGGFVAPFIFPELEWDFRLPLVRSINVSGHKFGLVYPGVGWVVWRSKDYLPDELVFHVNYLGADQPTFTLNFSKGASQLVAQYYQFIRLGFEGYRKIISNCHSNAKFLRDSLVSTGKFEIYSKEEGVPLVTFGLKDKSKFDEYHIADHLKQYGWIVPAYTMAPDLTHVTMLRVLVREDFSRSLGERFLKDLLQTLEYLTAHPPSPHTSVVGAAAAEVVKAAGKSPESGNTHHFQKFLEERALDPAALEQRVFRVFKKHSITKTTGVC